MAGFSDADDIVGIQTLEGLMVAKLGDWIIKGVKGEFYPCKPDIFESTYDKEPNVINNLEVNLSMEFQQFIRKPFVVEALEITRENIHELSDMIGTFGEDETGPFIQADPDKVPTVTRVTPGYWVTKMGRNIRCYSPKVFDEQFIQNTPELQAVLGDIEDGKVKASRG